MDQFSLEMMVVLVDSLALAHADDQALGTSRNILHATCACVWCLQGHMRRCVDICGWCLQGHEGVCMVDVNREA